MKHPITGADIVSVGELKRFLEENAFHDDSPVGIVILSDSERPHVRFPNALSVAKGTGLPDMLAFSAPPPLSKD